MTYGMRYEDIGARGFCGVLALPEILFRQSLYIVSPSGKKLDIEDPVIKKWNRWCFVWILITLH